MNDYGSEFNNERMIVEDTFSGNMKLLVQNIRTVLSKLKIRKSKKTNNFVVTNETLNKALDYVANFNKIIVAFDIEFHNVVTNPESNYLTVNRNNRSVAPFVRELGILFLAKDNNNHWNYLGNTFVNFNNDHSGSNIIYILSKYATVTDPARKIMEKNDKYFNVLEQVNDIILDDKINKASKKTTNIKNALNKNFVKRVLGKKEYDVLKVFLGYLSESEDEKKFKQTSDNIKRLIKDIPFNITRSALDDKELQIFNKQMKTYYQDKQVITRMITKIQEQELFKLLTQIDNYTCYLVKGKMDFMALKNNYYALTKTVTPIKFAYVYDIEVFNRMSNDKYGSAQLEKTFMGISTSKEYQEYVKILIDKIMDDMDEQRAHNPLVDALYTMAVALTINVNLARNFS